MVPLARAVHHSTRIIRYCVVINGRDPAEPTHLRAGLRTAVLSRLDPSHAVGDGRYLRIPAGWNRREADIADRDGRRLGD